MPSTTNLSRVLATERDLDILAALDRVPLTVRQLQFLSTTWGQPFPSLHRTRKRLMELARAGLVRYGALARFSAGQPEYYFKLAPAGWRFLHGSLPPPSQSRFRPLALAQQPHTHALAEFTTHALVAAARAGLTLLRFDAENTLVLRAGDITVSPDASFTLLLPDQRQYRFHVELDMGSQRLVTHVGERSWQKKIRAYEALPQANPAERFRVLVVSGRDSPQRLANILELARAEQTDPNRTLFLATALGAFTSTTAPLSEDIFFDPRGTRLALLPPPYGVSPNVPPNVLADDAVAL